VTARSLFGTFLAAVVAYGVGSLPTGYLLVRWRRGADIRSLGSGSTGARNVGRQLGPGWALLAAVLDVLKGALGVAVGRRVGDSPAAVPMLAVIAGHIWPVSLGFAGGRGIAPALGAVVVVDRPMTGIALTACAAGWLATRRARVGIALGIAAAPVAAIVLRRGPDVRAGVLGAAVLIVAGHRAELRTLLQAAARR
jgi:glycerol-3-phosphate acyltransferase PlsY